MPVIGENTKESTEEAVKTNTGETTDEEDVLVRISLGQKYSDSFLHIHSDIEYDFFIKKSYRLKSFQPFRFGQSDSLFYSFDIGGLTFTNILELSCFYPENDNRPFVLKIKKKNSTEYYGIKDSSEPRWTPIEKLNEVKEEEQNELLLYVLKEYFKKFFAAELRISEAIITNRKYYYNRLRFDVHLSSQFIAGYDKYAFYGNGSFSLQEIFIDSLAINFNIDISFVNSIFVYYLKGDESTPLLLEMVEYPFCENFPHSKFLKAKSLSSNEWVAIESLNKVTGDILRKQVEKVLSEIVEDYKTVSIDINVRVNFSLPYVKMTKRFENIPFLLEQGIKKGCKWCALGPKLSKSFVLGDLIVNSRRIDIRPKYPEIRNIHMFGDENSRNFPELLCIKNVNSSSGQLRHHCWYKKVEGTIWREFDFEAEPKIDYKKIHKKMKDLNKVEAEIVKELSFGFCLGLTIMIVIFFFVLGIRNIARLNRWTWRVFEYFKRKTN